MTDRWVVFHQVGLLAPAVVFFIGITTGNTPTILITGIIFLGWEIIVRGRDSAEYHKAQDAYYAALSDDERVEYHTKAAARAYYVTEAHWHHQRAQTILQRQIRDEQRLKNR